MLIITLSKPTLTLPTSSRIRCATKLPSLSCHMMLISLPSKQMFNTPRTGANAMCNKTSLPCQPVSRDKRYRGGFCILGHHLQWQPRLSILYGYLLFHPSNDVLYAQV
ncbi:hypothetical protein M430DRAFT_262311 [Amorphotheca resinae ATCC 22711]|uniref:Uncharacterized protein n=1 Tax=Amorphotheca resinae ATCC 22711 TaxID=857342 RepID=A0A2T3AW47_AMORE|nr:hypothetical protein M430DRAFT_262311 [Amorphotheca resinae ATCC 22711]PSS12902.1 hypothetical protein M430DRAFT_262311 [Amorphotheca resinae ATCC 22711]